MSQYISANSSPELQKIRTLFILISRDKQSFILQEYQFTSEGVTAMPRIRRGVKFLLFLSSYTPLFAILAFQYRGAFSTIYGVTAPYISIFFIGLCVASLPFLYLVIRINTNTTPDFREVNDYQRRNDQVTSYLLVYIFAFIGFDLFNIDNLITFVVFFGLVAVIQIRSSQLHVNPVLGAIGYDIYHVTTDREVALVMSNSPIETDFVVPDDEDGTPDTDANKRYLKLSELGNGVYITQGDLNEH